MGHVGLDHGGHRPGPAAGTEGQPADIPEGRNRRLAPGTRVVLEEIYRDDGWCQWTRSGVHIITRGKGSAVQGVMQSRVAPANPGSLREEAILPASQPRIGPQVRLPRTTVRGDDQAESRAGLRDDPPEAGARTVAGIHRERRQIELFSMALQQRLKGPSWTRVRIARLRSGDLWTGDCGSG